MADQDPRPISGDPSTPIIKGLFDANENPWWVITVGDMDTFGAETMLNDGSGHQRVVCVELPARLNKTTEVVRLRIMISPEGAAQLALQLAHTAVFVLEMPDG